MAETEITYQILDNFRKVKQLLLNNGFKLIKTFKMEDNYFCSKSTITNYKDLIANSFLVRKVDNKSFVIYKNKSYDSFENVVCEQKISFPITNTKNLLNILSMANFNPYVSVKTTNYIFKKNNIEFDIQDVKNLGLFIEIEESKEMKNLQPAQKIEKLKEIANSLGLKLGNNAHSKKVEMLLNKINGEKQ